MMYEKIICRLAGWVSICSILVSCSESKNKVKMDYMSVTDSVSMQTVAIDKELLMPDRLFVAGNNLVVYQPKEKEGIFTVFPLPFDGKGCRAGHIGRGPDDFIHIDRRSFVPCESGFRVADGDGAVKTVVIDSCLTKVSTKAQVSTASDAFNGMVELKDCYLNINLYSDEYEYLRYDKQSGKRTEICPYPEWSPDSDMMKAFIYNKYTVPHPSGDRFAAFYLYFRKIHIISQDGELLYERTLDFDGEPGAYEPASRGSYMAFNSDPVATEDYIAVPYLDRIKGRDRGGMTEIQFWSWDCELLHRLIFDKSFTTFTIDPKSNILYACPFNDPHHLYIADLSDILAASI